jgi:hypothetical protein
MKNRLVLIGVLVAVAGAVAGGYFLVRKLQKDREAVLSYIPPTRPQPVQTNPTQKRETVTYTEKDLEAMRKKGITPPGVAQPAGQMPQNSGEAAVQRSLRTIEEVNRINEMNRRIQEQQERIRNQR